MANAALRKRGSLLIWLAKEMTWLAPHDGSPGRPAVFSDAAIQFCLTIKVLFKLVAIGAPLVRATMATRQTTGMVASLLKMANLDWAASDYTTLCRRQKTLAVRIPYRRAVGPLNLLVDCTGIKFLGDGEWRARKHGVQGRRQWRKVHLNCSTSLSWIWALSGSITPARSVVAGVAMIGPENPSRTSFGNRPEWSICAWLRITAAILSGAKGNGR